MSNTLTVRLPHDLAEWLDQTAQKTGVSRGEIIRRELENARKSAERPYMRLAGVVKNMPPDLSMRKGFSTR